MMIVKKRKRKRKKNSWTNKKKKTETNDIDNFFLYSEKKFEILMNKIQQQHFGKSRKKIYHLKVEWNKNRTKKTPSIRLIDWSIG